MKGALDNVTRQFKLATSRWGKIEDLSRIEDSLELKIREFNDKLGAMERVSVKIDRLESEREEFLHQISSLQAKFQASDEEKKSLETSLAQTRTQFENALSLVKESGDEAKKFLYSEA